jgi:hypothetical protein
MKCDLCGDQIDEPVLTRTRILCPTCASKPRHRYYYLNRPPNVACQPDDFVDRNAWLPMQDTPDGWPAFGWVDYARKLRCEEIWKWEFRPANPEELAEYLVWREREGR